MSAVTQESGASHDLATTLDRYRHYQAATGLPCVTPRSLVPLPLADLERYAAGFAEVLEQAPEWLEEPAVVESLGVAFRRLELSIAHALRGAP